MGIPEGFAVSAVGFQSDSHLLVETCLARLRVDAELDDVPVLPTIDVLPESDIIEVDEVDTSELVIVCDSVKELPSAATIVRETVKANRRAHANELSQREVPTLPRMRTAAAASAVSAVSAFDGVSAHASSAPRRPVKHARWPVVLCALVATYFGTTAFIRSPLGAKPEVQHVVKVSRGHIAGAIQTTKSLVRL